MRLSSNAIILFVLVLMCSLTGLVLIGISRNFNDDGNSAPEETEIPDSRVLPLPGSPPPPIASVSTRLQFINWRSIQMPAGLPQSVDELIVAVYDWYSAQDIDFRSLDFGEASDDEAYTAVVGFAGTHLDSRVDPVYAQKVPSGLLRGAVPAELLTALPVEIQSLITALRRANLDGAAYYAMLQDGFAVVYTASNCIGPNCVVTVDNLQLNIESAAMGVFAVYRQGTVSSPEAAVSVVVNTFPALGNYAITPVPAEVGYGFIVQGMENGRAFGYFVDVVNHGNLTGIVIAAAVGQGYVNLGLWQ